MNILELFAYSQRVYIKANTKIELAMNTAEMRTLRLDHVEVIEAMLMLNYQVERDNDTLILQLDQPVMLRPLYSYRYHLHDSLYLELTINPDDGKNAKRFYFFIDQIFAPSDSVTKKVAGDIRYVASALCVAAGKDMADTSKFFDQAFYEVAQEIPNCPSVVIKPGCISLLTKAIQQRKTIITKLESDGHDENHYVLVKGDAVSIQDLKMEVEYIEKLKEEAKSGKFDFIVDLRKLEDRLFIKLDKFEEKRKFYDEAIIACGMKGGTIFYHNDVDESCLKRLRKSPSNLYKVFLNGKSIDLKSITKEINRIKKLGK